MALEWIAETLRLSIFTSGSVTFTNAHWKTITGQDEPEREEKVIGRRVLAGPFLNGTLAVSILGPRVDCILRPQPSTIQDTFIPAVGPWSAVAPEFIKATTAWLSQFDTSVVRLAFGAVTLTRSTDLQDAYETLKRFLKFVTIEPARMRELIYRVNWLRKSDIIKELTVNRITTWTVVQVQLQVMMEIGLKTTMVDPGLPTPVIRLEIDHNTDAERQEPFDPATLVPIYNELTNLAFENIEIGEVP